MEETVLGEGWGHSQYCKTFSGTLSLGLEIMLHQQETCQQSSPEFDESGTEVSPCAIQALRPQGRRVRWGPRTVWGPCPTESQSPRHGAHRPDPGHKAAEVKVKVTQSCPTLCDPMDYTVHGILQARMMDWVAFPCSRGSSQHKAVNLCPVPASMTYKLQRTIWAWSPEPWAAGGYDPGY